MSRTKEIEMLRSRLAHLEAEQAREEQAREALESAHAELMGRLQEADLDLEMFVRHFRKELSRVLTRIERQDLKRKSTTAASSSKKKNVKKRRVKVIRTIRIPAGSYHNIPPESARVFKVGGKGPRPKAVKEHAQKLGLELFLKQCRIRAS